MTRSRIPCFYEFFAGGGLVRAALGARWKCAFANDLDPKKCAAYTSNWGRQVLIESDVRDLTTSDLPGRAALAWASFPCQDLSLAGAGAGLKGDRSGTFWPFWSLMKELNAEGRAPKVIALENVLGTLTSHGGKDFRAICKALVQGGYRVGAVVGDASHFVPQSRPRLFIVAVREDVQVGEALVARQYSALWHSRSLRAAVDALPQLVKNRWIWWLLPEPKPRKKAFSDLIEETPCDVKWHSESETKSLLALMNNRHIAKVQEAKFSSRRMVGAIYKRIREESDGQRFQRAEVRFDDIAGCLRTPSGGSSRQVIMVVENGTVRSRLISGRETARLMGLPESYRLPKSYTDSYHLTGDGVVVPLVRFLARQLIEPLARS